MVMSQSSSKPLKNTYHVLSPDFKHTGVIITDNNVYNALQKAKLTMAQMGLPQCPMIVSDRQVKEKGDEIFRSPFGEAIVPAAQLSRSAKPKEGQQQRHPGRLFKAPNARANRG
jgi:hypothetical protein